MSLLEPIDEPTMRDDQIDWRISESSIAAAAASVVG